MERNIIFVIFVFSCLPDGSKVNCNHVNAFPPGDSSLCCGILLLVSFCVGKPSKTCRPRPQFWINLSAGSRTTAPARSAPGPTTTRPKSTKVWKHEENLFSLCIFWIFSFSYSTIYLFFRSRHTGSEPIA